MLVPVAERVYQLLHGGIFLRLPEARAVRLGQVLLRAIPVRALQGLAVEDPRLAVTLGGVRLPNPVILSSMYYDLRLLRRAMALGFGAVTTKSITVTARPGHPEPNLVRLETPEGPGFVNCNGFRTPGSRHSGRTSKPSAARGTRDLSSSASPANPRASTDAWWRGWRRRPTSSR